MRPLPTIAERLAQLRAAEQGALRPFVVSVAVALSMFGGVIRMAYEGQPEAAAAFGVLTVALLYVARASQVVWQVCRHRRRHLEDIIARAPKAKRYTPSDRSC